MSSKKQDTIRALRRLSETTYTSAPLSWCVTAAHEAIKSLIRTAQAENYKGPCDYCNRYICHSHQYSGLIAQLIDELPPKEQQEISQEIDEYRKKWWEKHR